MHELSLSRAIVAAAERHAGGRRVTQVAVSVGRLRQAVPATLEFYFGFAARGGLCEDAVLELTVIDARLRCAGCAHEWAIDEPLFRCPRCDGADVAIVAGDELRVESIEVEEAECTAPR